MHPTSVHTDRWRDGPDYSPATPSRECPSTALVILPWIARQAHAAHLGVPLALETVWNAFCVVMRCKEWRLMNGCGAPANRPPSHQLRTHHGRPREFAQAQLPARTAV
jgi:hypothetical protein